MQPRIRNTFIYIAWTRSKRAELLFWHRSFIHASTRSIVELILTGMRDWLHSLICYFVRFLYSYIAFLYNCIFPPIGSTKKLRFIDSININQSILHFEKREYEIEQILIVIFRRYFWSFSKRINLPWNKSLSPPRSTNLLTRERNKLAIRVFIEAKKKKEEEEEDGGCTLARLTTIGWTKGLDKRVFEFSGRPHRCKGEPG